MLRKTLRLILITIFLLTSFTVLSAQDQTVGVLFGEHEGYTLYTPLTSNQVYLIDDEGRVVNQWDVGRAGRDAFLRENGNIIVTLPRENPIENDFSASAGFASRDGRFAEYTWDGELVWEYEFEREGFRVHHGIDVMPDGNILFMAWEYISSEDAIEAGRDPETLDEEGLWPEAVFEYSPELDEIVWEWYLWDHIVQDFDPEKDNYGVIADNPQLVDINFYQLDFARGDWIHSNSLDYSPETGHIAFSARDLNEIWVFDRDISTEEASGEAGDLLYRWGNPQAYDSGTEADRFISFQHDVQWIPPGYPGEGNIITFSNQHTLYSVEGDQVLTFSRVVEVDPPLNEDGTYDREEGQAYAPAEPTWSFDGLPDNSFDATFISGTQRLPDGNTLVIRGPGALIFEVTPDGDVVWAYALPTAGDNLIPQGATRPLSQSTLFRARRYQVDYPAFEGRDMTPGLRIEDLVGVSYLPGAVQLGDTFYSDLNESIPQRLYHFEASAGQMIEITVSSEGENAINPYLILADSNQESLLEDDNSGDGESAYIQYEIAGDGEYFIIVGASPDSETEFGDFTVTLSEVIEETEE